jgi:drug/metabolite transporter (DMT)-like permease
MPDAEPATPDVRGKPDGAGAARRNRRDLIMGLLGVLFYGIWMVLFGVGTIVMAAILATGANNPTRTSLVAVLCAALSVFNGRRLRRPLRRLRGLQSAHTSLKKLSAP